MFDNIPVWLTFTLGFSAQTFFGLRTALQWLKSEMAHESVSPVSYWIFSVIGACLMFIYGVLRNDFSIILGQFIAYLIYLWNLNANGIWNRMKILTRVLLAALPFVAAMLLFKDARGYSQNFFRNSGIPVWLVVFGSTGQLMFTLRFVYQFAFSHHWHTSVLPRGFWIISIVGSGMIIIYGIIRLDPVLILGQMFGFVVYVRNLILGSGKKEYSDEKQHSTDREGQHIHPPSYDDGLRLHLRLPFPGNADKGFHAVQRVEVSQHSERGSCGRAYIRILQPRTGLR